MVVVDAIVAQHGIDSAAAWLRELGLQTGKRSAEALAEALAAALLDGNLVLVAQDRTPRTLDSPRVTPLRDLGPVAPVESVDHWIELQLEHETGGVYAHATVVVELANGKLEDLVLDDKGRGRIEGVDSSVQVRVHELELSDDEYRRPSTPGAKLDDAAVALRPGRDAEVSLRADRNHLVVVQRPVQRPTLAFDGACFGFDSAFPSPGVASMIGYVFEHAAMYSNARYCLFGHTDPSGDDAYNKLLSERRAKVMHALLTGDLDEFESVAADEDWGPADYQAMLRGVGNNPGAIDGEIGPLTKAAIGAFRVEYGKGIHHSTSTRDPAHGPLPDGDALDEPTKLALRDAYHANMMANVDPARFVGPQCAGCSEFNPQDPEAAQQRRVTLAVFDEPSLVPPRFPCTEGDEAACMLDQRDAVRCRFYRENFIDPGPQPAPGTFWDGHWLRTPTGKAHLSALTVLPDCDDLEVEVQACTEREVEELDEDSGDSPPTYGVSLGKLTGLVRKGVAYGLWTPPEGYDPFDVRDWFSVPGHERETFARMATPVFLMRRGARWIAGVDPGHQPDRVGLDTKESGEAVALHSDGSLSLILDVATLGDRREGPRVVAMVPGEHAVFYEEPG